MDEGEAITRLRRGDIDGLAVVAVELSSGKPIGCATVPLVPQGLVVTYTPAPEVPASCPVTLPGDPPFVPPIPYRSTPNPGDEFWHGSAALWTALPLGGAWDGLPHRPTGYFQKVFWWNPDYPRQMQLDPAHYDSPDFTVTGQRLDGSAPPLAADRATNASDGNGTSILVGVTFPTAGCWQVTGEYQGHGLSFVIWVGGDATPPATPATTATPVGSIAPPPN